MDDFVVIKVKFNGALRRISWRKADEPSFTALNSKIRDFFKIPTATALTITYLDEDEDEVTVDDDPGLKDALVFQKLNPLRLNVTTDSTPLPTVSPSLAPVASPVPSAPQAAAEEKPSAGSAKPAPAGSEPAAPFGGIDLGAINLHLKRTLEEAIGTIGGDGDVEIDITQLLEPLLKSVPSSVDQIAGILRGSPLPSQLVTEVEAALTAMKRSSSTGEEASTSEPAVAAAPQPEAPPKPKEGASTKEQAAPKAANQGAPSDGASEQEPTFVHNGVTCDVCQTTPIVGFRYKSNVKDDYDLCSACFKKAGSPTADYIKIARPLFRPRQHPFAAGPWGFGKGPRAWPGPARGGFYGGPPGFHGGPPGPFFGGRPFNCRPGHAPPAWRAGSPDGGKLDARFVRDVTIFDGTEMSPGTAFTKIWQLRNTGGAPWPLGTQLVHVGGDKLGANDAVNVQSAGENGVAPEEEVDVSVDLVAPEKPGRYVSHWRLLAPGGPKFGHRVWVLIQVVPKDEASPQVAESERMAEGTQESVEKAAGVTSFETAEPTPAVQTTPAPAETVPVPAPASPAAAQAADLIDFEGEVIDIEGVTPPATPAPTVADVPPVGESDPAVEEQQQQTLPFPVVVEAPPAPPAAAAAAPALPAPTAPPAPASPLAVVSVGGDTEATSVGNFALVDAPSAPTSVDGSAPASPRRNPSLADRVMAFDAAADMAAPPAEAPRPDARMEKILQQLEAMGFKDGALNLEVLQAHKMNIQAAVDDLIASAELDSQLADLKEMGFEDEQSNRRLLKKNKGDMKLTIRDIVQMDRQSASKAKEA